MLLLIKLPVLRLTMVVLFFLFIPKVNAQTCDDAINSATSYYYNGDYDNVHVSLSTCLTEFNTYRADYQSESYSHIVFKVYKLITSSYEQSGLEYYAEDKENELIYFFDGIYNPGDVLDILYNTEI